MKIAHCILVKWLDKSIQNEKLLDEISSLFNKTLEIEGIEKVELITNVVDRANRYDLLIKISMEETSLSVYDASSPHKAWKENFGNLIEKKAIFDFEI